MKKMLLVVAILNLMGCENSQAVHKEDAPQKPAIPKLSVADFSQKKTLSDEQILALAQLKMNDPLNAQLSKNLGSHHGVPMVFEQICSDVCPNYTVRLIHYQLSPKQTCQMVGGAEKTLLIPAGIAAVKQKFCFPKIIMDNWATYQHSYDNFAEVNEK